MSQAATAHNSCVQSVMQCVNHPIKQHANRVAMYNYAQKTVNKQTFNIEILTVCAVLKGLRSVITQEYFQPSLMDEY